MSTPEPAAAPQAGTSPPVLGPPTPNLLNGWNSLNHSLSVTLPRSLRRARQLTASTGIRPGK